MLTIRMSGPLVSASRVLSHIDEQEEDANQYKRPCTDTKPKPVKSHWLLLRLFLLCSTGSECRNSFIVIAFFSRTPYLELGRSKPSSYGCDREHPITIGTSRDDGSY